MAEYSVYNSVPRTGGQFYAERFLRSNYEVCWVLGAISPFHLLKANEIPHLEKKLKLWLMGGDKAFPIFSYCPLTFLPFKNFPLFRTQWAGRNTLKYTLPSLKGILRKQGFLKTDIFWIANLGMHSLLEMVNYKVSIFRFSDNLIEFKHIPKTAIEIQEKIIKKVDIVIATAKFLAEKARKVNKHTYYVPNGVDWDRFSNAGFVVEPIEYKEIAHPRVIYVGAIDYWFDISLLDYVTDHLKEYNFVLIGKPMINLSRLENKNNFVILGPKDYNQIPAYLKYSDVGIIPFKRNALTNSVNPIKLYEYLACGLPVVSTNLDEVKAINAPCLVAESPEEFVNLIEVACESEKNKPEFFEFVKRNSWDNRFEFVKSIAERYL